ncbi:hypothetical protein E2636_09280 [Paenisporosarcina antarctica]|uniref:Uncharacterized protein n=2 Tax=Paenisporosarcina antarctica TaxID=417367 RepID=A0A4P6ZXF3_9BACL|nr:hypothetical protein E2636_09280 [Paenisporosarcina antarctica]
MIETLRLNYGLFSLYEPTTSRIKNKGMDEVIIVYPLFYIILAITESNCVIGLKIKKRLIFKTI